MEPLAGIPGTVGGAVFMNAGSFGTEIKDVVTGVEIVDREGSIRRLSRSEIGFSYRSSSLPKGSIIISAEFRLSRDKPESVSKRIRETIRKKALSQPLNYPSAGCVFKNPPDDSAGRLIDIAGCKGMRCGGIEVSSVHANFFINTGGGTFDDFINLMEEVRDRVYKTSGIKLEPEIHILRRGG
jgi:UDP-N-acetylmuramate dehydrogenase